MLAESKQLEHCIVRCSIVVSISACHVEDPDSIPVRGVCRKSRYCAMHGAALCKCAQCADHPIRQKSSPIPDTVPGYGEPPPPPPQGQALTLNIPLAGFPTRPAGRIQNMRMLVRSRGEYLVDTSRETHPSWKSDNSTDLNCSVFNICVLISIDVDRSQLMNTYVQRCTLSCVLDLNWCSLTFI